MFEWVAPLRSRRRSHRWTTLRRASVATGAAVVLVVAARAVPALIDVAPAPSHAAGASAGSPALDAAPGASQNGAGDTRDPRPAVRVATAPGATPPVEPRLRVLNPGTAADVADHSADEPAAPPAVTDDDDLDPSGTRADWFPPGSATYRTVCVRLCDGAMTPISFATSKDRLALDALRCRRSCSGATRLYVERNLADESGRLVDLDGKPY